MMRTSRAGYDSLSTKPVWGAFAWSLAFGVASLYWAAGGTAGLSTLAQSIQEAAREGDDAMLLTTAITGLLKIGGGLLALASLRPVGGRRIRTVMRSLLWDIGILYTLYGVVGFFEKLLMRVGVLDVPDGLGEDAVTWYLAFWEPFWVLGGVLFLLTARRLARARLDPRSAR